MTGPNAADPPPTASDAPTASRRTPLIAWVGLVLIVSVAGAGLILSLDHPPTDQGRPELTARGHAIVAPRIDTLATDLEQLADAAASVATAGRDTLTRIRALDPDQADAALTAGATAATNVATILERFQADRAALLDGTTMDALPVVDRTHIGAIDSALAAAAQLPDAWQQVALAATDPQDVLRSMAAHDASVISATDAGRAGQWADAIAHLVEAQRQLVPAHAVRDEAKTAHLDVSTLSDLLDRLDTYDAALTDLYTSLQSTGGQTTAESQAILERVNAAQQSLPEDQTAMVVIVSDLAGPTITPVLLSIETARGAIESAIDAQATDRPDATDAAGPTDEPSDALESDALESTDSPGPSVPLGSSGGVAS